jgi:hypothetical protein
VTALGNPRLEEIGIQRNKKSKIEKETAQPARKEERSQNGTQTQKEA